MKPEVNEVYIVSAARTPIGSMGGSLSSVPATKLGSIAIKAAVERAGISVNDVEEVLMGNVLSANLGQAPATQAARFAGLPDNVPSTTINKVCASGTKALMLAAQSIMLGDKHVIVAGGMENMSSVPYYLGNARTGYKLGHQQATDGLIKDGLWDVYNDYHMGSAAELCATDCKISREDQDAYAVESYTRSQQAQATGKFTDEIVSVMVDGRGGVQTEVKEDEEVKAVKFEKIPTLKPVFKKDGSVTAANASSLNDGAAALVLMSKEKADAMGIKPLARILAFADAQQAPEWFTTAPSKAIPFALDKAGLKIEDVDYFEINEAFSVVAIANNQKLGIHSDKVNVNGGAVSMGHPLGCSGARIVVTLLSVLKQNNGKIGVVGICNGGGGASAMVIENLQ